jgi:serralysin
MNEIIKVCIDKVIKSKGDPYGDPRGSMAVLREKRWDVGQTLRIRFLSGDPEIQAKVQKMANDWLNYANIKFNFVADGDSDIRIDFQTDGSWSTIGTDAKDVPQNEATMNFGWLDLNTPDDEYSRVVKHEFGHALGAIHEHQSPSADIPWDKEAVYRYFNGPPNNWPPEEVDHNLFERYSKNITNYTRFDPGSIMLYQIPAEFTTNRKAIGGWNTDLSEQDKTFMGEQYA